MKDHDEARPVEFDWPEYHWQGMGCGLEDRGITDRYEACQYGFQEGVARCAEMIEHHMPIYTATDYEALRAEVERLRQAHWDARAVMGFDNDGDPTPHAVVSDFCELILRDAKAMRADLDESRKEAEAAEARVAAYAEQLQEARTDLSLTRTNILIEIEYGRGRWEGVPEHLQSRIDEIDTALNYQGQDNG